MKGLCRLLVFLLVFQCFSSLGFAATTSVSWGDTQQGNYDTSVPGTKLFWSDPLAQGGMNLTTGTMTRGRDADVVFSPDGAEIGSNEIIDLGAVDFDGVDQVQDNGYQQLIKAIQGHVYLIKRADGTFAKLEIISKSDSEISIQYALEGSVSVEPPQMESIELIGPASIKSSPVTFKVNGILDNGEKVAIPNNMVDWKSSDKAIGTIANGVFKIAGKPGKVTITATYNGMVKALTYNIVTMTSMKFKQTLKYSPTPVTLTVVASYSDKTTAAVKADAVKWKSNNSKVATVNSKGRVTFTGKPGKVTITASYNGKTASATTTVGNVVKSLTTKTKLTYNKKPIKVALTAIYMDGKKVTVQSGAVWKSSNTKVAKVSSTGVVTFTGQNGDVTITATYQGRKLSLKTTVARVDPYFGKWKLWIPGTMIDYFYKSSGNYAASKYTNGSANGSLTINKDGTYQLNGKKGKWRVAKKGEVFNHPVSIILIKAIGSDDVAVTAHDRKKGYIKLMTDSKGQYTDGSKIWIFGSEGYK